MIRFGGARRALTAVALTSAVVAPVGLASTSACAREGDRAALVVDTGERVRTLCVQLPDSEVSGIELIELASDQLGLDYTLGFGGEAVCRLDGVGVEGGDCFADFPRFWGYWRGDGSGGWEWSSVGAGSTTVSPGDVEGWSWGEGTDGQTHPSPPAATFDGVCTGADATPTPSTESGGAGGENDASGGSAVGGSETPDADPGEPSPGGARAADGKDDEAKEGDGTVGARDERDADVGTTPVSSPASSGLRAAASVEGGWAGRVAAIGVVLALGVAAAALGRKRRRGTE